jgi:hypothetical protein
MSSAIQELISSLSHDLENLQEATGGIDSQSMARADQAQGQAMALGVNEVAATLEAVKDEIREAVNYAAAAAGAIERARAIAAALPT